MSITLNKRAIREFHCHKRYSNFKYLWADLRKLKKFKTLVTIRGVCLNFPIPRDSVKQPQTIPSLLKIRMCFGIKGQNKKIGLQKNRR